MIANSVMGLEPVANQFNNRYDITSPIRHYPLLDWHQVTGSLVGLFNWTKTMGKTKTISEFVKQAKKVHGGRYKYDLVDYIHGENKIKIICRKHGIFEQVANSHLQGHGCFRCGIESTAAKRKRTILEFLVEAKNNHGDYYDYSKVIYRGVLEKVIIICPIHGEFKQIPREHLSGSGCSKCADKRTSTKLKSCTEEFIKKSKRTHGNIYDYSKVNYIRAIEKVIIICEEHGEFEQIPMNHLKGSGCPICGRKKADQSRKSSREIFVGKAKIIHKDKYDYSLVEYKSVRQKVKIICSIHGVFYQTPDSHLMGSGCTSCCTSIGEDQIKEVLQLLGIKFYRQKRFILCREARPLPFDFYFELDGKKVLIEYDGEHHFKAIKCWGGEKHLEIVKRHDKIKNDFARNNGFILIRIPYTIDDIDGYLRQRLRDYE